MNNEIQQAIESRNWESLTDDQLQKAENQLREDKNHEKGGIDIIPADKWIGVKKEMINRGVN